MPDSTGPYTITIKYGGDEIPYSPYRIQSLPTGDASKCLLTGKKKQDTMDVIILINTRIKHSSFIFILTTCSYSFQFLSEDTAYVSNPAVSSLNLRVSLLGYILINAFVHHFVLIPSLSLTANLQKLQTSEDTVITVDAKAAGKGKVTCKVQTPQGMELDMDVVENHDGTFDIYYTAPEPGKYVITIRFGGQNIPKSPFHVVVSKVNLNSCCSRV